MPIPLSVQNDIDSATTLTTEFYTSSDLFEKSKDKIFARTWQFCFSKEIMTAKDCMHPFTLLPGLLDEPLLFSQIDHQLHCLSNVCTHRGSILINKPCSQKHIICPYHGRRFNLDGKFIHMPEFEKTKNFPTERDNLLSIPSEELHPFIFAALEPRISFNTIFNNIKKRLNWLPWEKMKLQNEKVRDYQVNAHWALYCENYLEGLHIPFVHKALRSILDFKNYQYELYPYLNLQLALANETEDAFDIPVGAPDYGKKVAAYYYWVFPNTMLNFYPWGCSVNVVKPISRNLTHITFLPYIYDESRLDTGAGGDLNTVELEDEAIVESVQKGLKSRFYRHGRYSPTMEQGTHHFHQLICEFMNG